MKSIIQSINPEHVFNMRFGGKRFPLKRIEVRKTSPDETPFKAYIYETKQKEKSFISKTIDGVETKVIIRRGGCGKVVGEYICRKVEIVRADNMIQAYYSNRPETRVTDEQLFAYANGRPLKFLYMEDVIFYDKPKELGEFSSALSLKDIRCKHIEKRYKTYNGKPYIKCTLQNCVCEFRRLGTQTDCDGYEMLKEPARLTKAPRSWCYVEELEETAKNEREI